MMGWRNNTIRGIVTTKVIRFIAFTGAVCLMMPLAIYAQSSVSLAVYGQNHHNIRSYSGYTPDQNHRIHLQLKSPGILLQNWSIRGMIMQPLQSSPANVSGKVFPTDKIKFKFVDDQFSGNPPDPRPTIQNLQLPMVGVPFQPAGSETTIIPTASVPLATGGSHHVNIYYDFQLEIAGGRYLGEMLSDIGGATWNQNPAIYRTTIRFTLYNEFQQAIAFYDYPLALQVHRPLGNPPPDEGEGFNIEIIGEARNGKLSFNVPEDYLQSNSVSYASAVKINAQSGYQVKVKSMQPEFTSTQGNNVALDVLKVELTPTNSAPNDAIVTPIRLSTALQAVVSSNTGHMNSQFFDLKYTTDANDPRLSGTRPGKYSTILLYELTPR